MHIDREIYIHINHIYRVFTAVSFDDTNLRLLNPNTVQQPTPGKHILFYSAKNFLSVEPQIKVLNTLVD